jgi:hypothetical protein
LVDTGCGCRAHGDSLALEHALPREMP